MRSRPAPRIRPLPLRALLAFPPVLLGGWLALRLGPGGVRGAALLLVQLAALVAAAQVLAAAARRPLRAWARDLVAQAACLAGYAAWVALLVAWPLAAVQRAPSLGASLLLSLALCFAVASLWWAWPWAGVLVIGGEQPSAPARRRAHALAAAAQAWPAHYMLPVALGQLGGSFSLLLLAGFLPAPMRLLASPLADVVVLLAWPLLALLIIWRCRAAARLEPETAARHAPVRAPGGAAAFNLDSAEVWPGRREDALLAAARSGDTERALALLAADADPNTCPGAGDADRRSVLALAALLPDTRLLRALIAHGASVHGSGEELAPLLLAVRDGHHHHGDAVLALLANGARVEVTDAEGNTALHYAALRNDVEVAAMLVDAAAPVNASNRAGYTPLALACRAGHEAMAGWLLQHGAQADVAAGVPALVAAADAAEDAPAIVELLCGHRARVDAVDVLGRSALMHAALAGHAGAVRALLAARARVDQVDAHGTTALMEAARAGSNAVLAVLAEAGPEVGRRDRHGRDALVLACQSQRANADTVRVLLDLGADPRRPGGDGRSALEHAAGAGRWDLVALLDPETPLPAAHQGDVRPEAGADSPAHLLDALRFGHWASVSGFAALVPTWAQAERAAIFLDLAGAEHAAARAWLFAHGLQADACLDDQRRLTTAVIDALPAAIPALLDLLDRGQSLAGRGLLARALGRLGEIDDPELMRRLLAAGGDLFGADAAGLTPLHHAAAQGRLGLLQTLLAAGCNPNARDHGGQTPLHHALKQAEAAALPLFHALIRHGADPEAADSNGETPLGRAIDTGQEESVHWLRWRLWPLPGRALRDADLPAAASAGDVASITRLLTLGFAVDARDARGASALVQAAGRGHEDVVRALLDAGADLSQPTPAGATPLTAAVTARRLPVLKLLLARGAPLEQRLPGGGTALLVGAALGHAETVVQLLAVGADVAARDHKGRTALHAAAQFCFSSNDSLAGRRLLDVLLAHGADATALDASGASALLFLLGALAPAGASGNATHLGALLPVLLAAGAPVTAADERGVTPLHACAMHALLGPAKALLAAGADRGACDAFGRTPAAVAELLGFVDLARELGPAARGGSA